MKDKALIIALCSSLLVATPVVFSADVPDAPHLVTSGNATIQAVPDMATLQIEVNTQASQAGEAKNKADQRVAAYFDFLKQQGVPREDINAANVTTQPYYDYSQKGQPKRLGYQATRQMTVKLHQLEKLNPLLDGALKAGLNEINGVSMGVADPEKYRQQARSAAIKDAITQAQAVAKGFGSGLGTVWSIQYQAQPASPAPAYRMLALKTASAATTADETYQQSKLDFEDHVNVVFELKSGSTVVSQ